MEMIIDVLADALADCLKMLPFLFTAFLLIEGLEHYSTKLTRKALEDVDKAGPVVGALVGCVPQCGFSVMASNLYAGGIISVGTLLSVFLATSDEAVLILLGNPDQGKTVLTLLAVKVVIAVVAGYIIDLFLQKQIATPKECGNLCDHCGCHDHHARLLKPALRHTIKIFLYLFVFTAILNFIIEVIGIQTLSEYLLADSIFQPVIAALIGLIPNCAASVVITQLYISGAISFASAISGLCTGAGIGLVVLFKVNRDKRENIKIVLTLYALSVIAGMVLQIFGF